MAGEILRDNIDWGGSGRPRVWGDELFDGNVRRLREEDLIEMAGPVEGVTAKSRMCVYQERFRASARRRGEKVRTKLEWLVDRGEKVPTLVVQAMKGEQDVPF